MKKSVKSISILLMFWFAFCFTHCTGVNEKNFRTSYKIHVIELQVDTEQIQNNNEWKKYCRFKGQAAGDLLKDFETEVKKGDIILWVGVSNSNIDDEVLINKVKYKGDTDLLKKNNSGNGVVVAKVKSDAQQGQTETYSLHFKVKRTNNPINNNFDIDPKLRIY